MSIQLRNCLKGEKDCEWKEGQLIPFSTMESSQCQFIPRALGQLLEVSMSDLSPALPPEQEVGLRLTTHALHPACFFFRYKL